MPNLNIKNSFQIKRKINLKADNKNTIKKKIKLLSKNSSKLTLKEKIKIFLKLKKNLLVDKKKILNLITFETRVSLKDSEYEFNRVIDCINLSIKFLKRKKQNLINSLVINKKGVKVNIFESSLKIVFAITPFNLPFVLSFHKIFPAIYSDSRLMLKPSEKTPLSSKYLIETLYNCGLPKNYLQYIIGSNPKKIVKSVLSHDEIDMVSFTGSSKIGMEIKKMMIKNNHHLKKFVPELGGCSSLIICNDANLKKAVRITLDGCFKYSGQRCTSVRRVLVENKIANKFIKLLLQNVSKIKYGNPFNKYTDLGPVIDTKIYNNAKLQVNKAIRLGAKHLYGNFYKDNVISPIILDKVNINMGIVAKETFGPICPIIRVKNIDEAIKFSNKTKYKMAGAIVTKSKKKFKKAFNEIEVGQFSVNGPPGFRLEEAPFGGFENSGNGEKEGLIMSSESMRKIRVLYQH